MNTQYLALLRGINVGGNSLIKMADLRLALEKSGLGDVTTYINSGNVLFQSDVTDTRVLAEQISKVIGQSFGLDIAAVVFTKAQWQAIVAAAPAWWGKDPDWRHNLWVLLPPFDMRAAVSEVGVLKSDIEAMQAGKGVLYQAVSIKGYGRSTTSRIVGKPLYKRLTIRNYNTATKLCLLLEEKAD